MVTMLLGGLWHGANWTFVLWGGLHGVYLMVNHGWVAVSGRSAVLTAFRGSRLGAVFGWALTFFAVVVAWVFFRAPISPRHPYAEGHGGSQRIRIAGRPCFSAATMARARNRAWDHFYPIIRRPVRQKRFVGDGTPSTCVSGAQYANVDARFCAGSRAFGGAGARGRAAGPPALGICEMAADAALGRRWRGACVCRYDLDHSGQRISVLAILVAEDDKIAATSYGKGVRPHRITI